MLGLIGIGVFDLHPVRHIEGGRSQCCTRDIGPHSECEIPTSEEGCRPSHYDPNVVHDGFATCIVVKALGG
jgi:hypothetical protein